MASKKVQAILNLEVVAGKAQPAPPLWPMLGANGVNIGAFIQDVNAKTQDYMQKFSWADVKIKCKLTVYQDRTYDLEILWPVTSNLILRKAKQKKWSSEPNKIQIGTITRADVEDIVEIQKRTLNTNKLESKIKIVTATAKNLGVKVQ